MASPSERVAENFDELVSKIFSMANHRLLYKLSSKTTGEEFDIILSHYVTPALKIQYEDTQKSVSIAVYVKDRADFSKDIKKIVDSQREIVINWHPEPTPDRNAPLSKIETFTSESERLSAIVGAYEQTATRISAQEADVLGFPEDFVKKLLIAPD